MRKRFYKHKLLLDENLPLREYFPSLNSKFNIRHIAADYHQSGLPDPEVYKLALNEKRILVTYNIKDFKKLITQDRSIGIIGISPNMPHEQLDKKLTSFLIKSTEKQLLGKVIYISGELKKN